jgi:hypothetical protein
MSVAKSPPGRKRTYNFPSQSLVPRRYAFLAGRRNVRKPLLYPSYGTEVEK